MTRIQSSTPSATQRTQAHPKAQTPSAATQAAPQQQVNRGWAAKTGAVSTPSAPRYPAVATEAKAFVDAQGFTPASGSGSPWPGPMMSFR